MSAPDGAAAGPAEGQVDLPGDQPMTLVDWLNASLGWIAAGEIELARDKIEEVAAELAAREDATALAGRTAEGGAGDGFRVSISTMRESGKGESYTVTIYHPNRPKDATIFDSEGRMEVYSTYERENADHCADEWQEFFALAAFPAAPDTLADVQAKADARRAAPAAGVEAVLIEISECASNLARDPRDRIKDIRGIVEKARLSARDRGPADPRAGAVTPELRRLSEAATPGPWQLGRMGSLKMEHVIDCGVPPKAPYLVSHADDSSSRANAALALAAVNDLRARIAAEDRARGAEGGEASE